jgi:hypothetical protein
MTRLVIILALISTPQLPEGVTCEQIKLLVAEHGKARAIIWARSHGYSWKQINEARRCL